MHVRHPVWLRKVSVPGAEAFAFLFALESFSRAVLATVIPLEVLRHVGDAQKVSLLFFLASFAGLGASFAVPWLVRRTARRWVYSAGGIFLILAAGLLGSNVFEGVVAGLVFRLFGVVALTSCLSLYIMDHIDRRELNRSEPMRLFYSAGAWSLGPFVGVYLWREVADGAPFALSICFSIAMLAYFWFLRLSDSKLLQAAKRPVPNPLRNVKRYSAQPRLVLAWLISLGRNVWWVMFFIYAPIYAVTSGLGELVGGLIVSAGTGFMFIMPLFGAYLRRVGLRRLFVGGFLMAGLLTLAAVVAHGDPRLVLALLLGGALCMVSLDAGGNVLFLAAVRPSERPEMTPVYSTYRDMSELAPPGVFALLLKFFELPVVFLAGGATMVALAGLSLRIHPRLGRAKPATQVSVAPAAGR